MPPKNLLIITLTIIVSLACYSVAARNRFANLFAEALEVVDRQSLHPVPVEDLFISAMDGMMEEFDDYSMYISGQRFQDFDEDMRQELSGVGMYVEVDPETDQLVVLAPMPNTPASEVGLKVADQIVAVDGVTTKGMQRREALKLIRGPVGESVELELNRDGESLTKSLTRKRIPVASVHGDTRKRDGSWNFKLNEHPRIGYIRLIQFGEKSAVEISAALKQLGDVDGLVFDIRNNSGGLLDVAVKICDMFLPADLPIVRTLGRNKVLVSEEKSTGNIEFDSDIPIYILIDRNSASASEIVAGCLQDHGRAIVIGEQSWGKGTVQNVIPIQRNQSALKLTTASYWRPSGKNIDRNDVESKKSQIWGVQPNDGFAIELSERESIENLRQINIRELRTLVSAKELQYIRRLRRLQAEAFDEAVEARSNSDSPEIGDDPANQEPHVDLPLQKAIDQILKKKRRPNIAA
jgi:carboxyl-terminal processing protease